MKQFLLILTIIVSTFSLAQPDIKGGEYFLGTIDPGNGNGIAFTVIDGAWDEAVESIIASAQIIPNTSSPILINVRLKDNLNNWGPLFKKTLFINGGISSTRSVDISYAEYFFGVFDPGEGQGTPIIAFDGAFDGAVESVLRTNATWTVSNQPTLFNIRMKDTYNNWGPLFKKTVFPYGANPNAELIAQGNSMSVCPNTNVTLTYNGPNGYSPTWFNGSTTNSITFPVTSVGYYVVTASSGNSTYLDSIYIDFLSTPSPVISPSGSILVCGSSVTTLSTPVMANINYQWYFNNNQISGATSANYLPSQAGNYYVAATSIINSCVGNSNITNLFTTATISPSNSILSCTSPVLLTASLGTGNTYQWKLNGVNISGATSSTFNATASGNYSITITNGSCVSTSAATSVTITSGPLSPVISASGSTTFCSGGSVTLTSSSATGNTWSNGLTTQSITVNQSGSYAVTVSNGTCSASSTPTVVTVNSITSTPTISASGATTFCSGGSVTLTSSSATGNTWSNGSTSQSITVSQSGSYSVTVSNGSCIVTSSPSIVTVNSPVNPSFTQVGAICSGGSFTLPTTSINNIAGSWSPAINNTATTTYTFTPNTGQCANNTTMSVTVSPNPPAPTISTSGATTFCTGGSVILTSSSATGNTWSNGSTSQSITVSQSGSYSVTVSNGSCIATSSPSIVTVNSPVNPSFTQVGAICSGGSFILPTTSNNSINGSWSPAINNTATTTYTFTPNAGQCANNTTMSVAVNQNPPSPTISTSSSTTFCLGGSVTLTSSSATGNTWSNGATTQTINVNQSGSYSVTVSNGTCTSSSTPTVVLVNPVPPTPTITPIGNTTFCQGDSVLLASSYISGNTWSTGNTASSIYILQSGLYSVQYTDNNGCGSVSAPIAITVLPKPQVIIATSGPTSICEGDNVILTSSPGVSYFWTNGSTTQSITVNQSGTYSVLTGGSNGCSAQSLPVQVSVNSNSFSTITTNAIDSYILNGQTYTQSGTYTQVITNVAGCDSTITLNLSLSFSGLNELLISVKAYPNPTSGKIFIEGDFSEQTKFTILDAIGKEVFYGKLNTGVNSIDLENLSRGTYNLFIDTNNIPIRIIKN
jgi:hypothetical protein